MLETITEEIEMNYLQQKLLVKNGLKYFFGMLTTQNNDKISVF